MYASLQAILHPCSQIIGVLLATSLISAGAAHAASNDKISTDRPDFVESSAVVGKGRLQIETGLAWDRTNTGGTRERSFTTPVLLRMGLGDTWELRLESDGRTIHRSKELATGVATVETGYADASLGAKWHVRDGQGSTPSVGILLNLDMNTGTASFRGNGLRPSLRATAEWELPADFSLGVMPGISYDKTDSGKRFASGIFGIVLGKQWADRFATFIELAAPQIAHASNGDSMVYAGTGATYLLSDSWQVDAALRRGLNRNTPDWAWTIGLSARF
ncbi:outer membrane putative beta-barrel porin/alpha-amylase [Paucimonas lemoignei]|uniref:Outer membrane putative beta-barrel porin/alpha-amylase n=1 Tax=Paucimonas lemoignei TaxID=29443 RepID=A0A4R3HZF9_PAULE|nr:transporter [Paucimonas lemoignei]TCS38274.1 outer membrane putative beta-barrel porin/alpha-amylase [Paucimonas lemoignei]